MGKREKGKRKLTGSCLALMVMNQYSFLPYPKEVDQFIERCRGHQLHLWWYSIPLSAGHPHRELIILGYTMCFIQQSTRPQYGPFFSPYTTKRGNPNTRIYGQHLNLITASSDRVRMYENELVDIPIGLFGHGSICSNNRIATCKTHIEGRIPMALFFLRFSLNYWGMEWGCPSSSVVPFMSTSERKMMRPFFLHFATLFGVFCEK